MFRITKRVLAGLLLGALLASPSLAEDLISQEDIVQENTNYKTFEVIQGDFIVSDQVDLKAFYPRQFQVAYEGEPAHFVEFVVKRGTEVKKGDLLASLYYERDEVRVERLRLNLERAREALDEEKELFEEELLEMKKNLEGISDRYERQLAQLDMERRMLEHEQSCYQQEYAIEKIQEELDEILLSYEQVGLYAPMDGVVEDFEYQQKDALIYDGQVLITLNDPDVLLLEGSKTTFRFGMPVTVEMGAKKNRKEYSARVVCADNVLPAHLRNGKTYVLMDEWDPDKRLVSPGLRGDTVVIQNVLLADRKTVNNLNGSFYVNRLEDNTPKMRFINVGRSNSSYAWVLQGVQAGEELIDD